MNPILESALMFAQLNYKVFPLNVKSKKPQVLASWKTEASCNVDQVRRWFENTNYNYGIVTGNGLMVIDIDNKKGKSGSDSIKEWLPQFPKTLTVKTPNNGYHLYYLIGHKNGNRVDVLPGIDLRCDGGYVVGPGSITDDGEYIIIDDSPIARANDAVFKFFNQPKTTNKSINIESTINEGSRNDTLFKTGMKLLKLGMSETVIYATLESMNYAQCNPPLPDNEVGTILRSVINYREEPKIKEYKVTWRSAVQISQQEYKGCTDIVEGMIPIGVTILASQAKNGKTFFAMQLANAVAQGKGFLGHKCKKRKTYYIALEDPEHEQVNRLKNNLDDVAQGYDIEFCNAYDSEFDVEEKIKNYLHYNPDLGVVIIDTFEKIRNNPERKYKDEYKEISYFHELGEKYGIAIILIMHTTKKFDYVNLLLNITGSSGVQASGDSILILYRRYSKNIKYLHIEGKSVKEEDLVLRVDSKMNFSVVDDNDDDCDVDEELLQIIKYVISVGIYEGPCEKLGVLAGLERPKGKHIRALLENNKETLNEFFIKYKVPSSRGNDRKIKLKYIEESSDENDANDDLT